MNLSRSIEWIRDHEKDLSLFNIEPDDRIADSLRTYFGTQNVGITVRQTPSGAPEDLAVLSDATGVLALVDVSTLREMTDGVPTGSGGVGIADGSYESVLRHLKETTFTSRDTSELFYASREIEDRARRVGRGSIHAGFQRCSIMAEQRRPYRDLARRGLSVHAYGVPDTTPPELGPGTVHAVEREEIEKMWFVVFDGGGDDSQKTALIAEERAADEFYGAWTYDPGVVDSLLAYLDCTYDPSTDTETPSQ